MNRWKALCLFATSNLTYSCFILIYVAWFFNYEKLFVWFLFYFSSPYSDFILWFPNYHSWLFALVVALKVVFFSSVLGMLWAAFKNRWRLTRLLDFNESRGYLAFISIETGILLFTLAYYLTLHAIARLWLENPLYSNVEVLVARGFLFQLVFQVITVLYSHWSRVSRYLTKFFLIPQLPYNIAVLRILFFSYLAFLYFTKWHSALGIVGLESRVALPGIGWLIDILPINPEIYVWAVKIGAISCAMIVIGFRTRFFLILNAILCFYIFATPNFFGKLWHEQLIIWITWFLALSKCYDVFSVDAVLNKTPVIKSPQYTFPIRLVWLQLGVIYFWAGLYKLWDSGFDWALGQSMVNQVQLEWLQHYDQAPSLRIDKWPLLLHIGGMAAILFELSYILLVLRPKLRWLVATAGLAMHNIIGYFMYISFSMMLQAFYVFYINFNPLFQRRAKAVVAPIVNTYSRFAFGLGLTIVGINFCYGMFSIDSYPFSSYPKYSSLIPDSISVIRWDVYTNDGKVINAHQIGKENGFRWEDYGWLEHNIIRDFEAGINMDQRTTDYWKMWTSHNPQLTHYTMVIPTIVRRSVGPEGRNNLVFVDSLTTIYK
jgi:hypothetical protein